MQLVALAAAACASAAPRCPVAVQAGQRTRVLLVDVTTGRSFVLQNASSGSANEVYSDPVGDRAVKVVTDANLQQLLDSLASHGMFERAASAPTPDARDVLVVESQGKSWVWSRRLPGIDPAERPFHEARTYYLTFYNQVTAYHAGPLDKAALQQENERAQQKAEAARARLEKLQGSGR